MPTSKTGGWNSLRWQWVRKYLKPISLIQDSTLGIQEYQLLNENQEDLINNNEEGPSALAEGAPAEGALAEGD